MSGGQSYTVDLVHLDAVTARIAGLQGFVEDSLNGVDQRVAAIHREWSGAAATAHAEAHAKWQTGATAVREGIAAMRAAAATAHTAYSDGIAANLRMFGR
ncbi:WXG100 family type VII secretion target [Nocardia brasiliensis]|uniref:WXG100 family type VII secretion target n=1 Tax=Nocardia brasiliensis TaxID=37326 RepID=UPI002456F738|nr:WXG100 family type VII secretion target [Nocardia brasiliensis]